MDTQHILSINMVVGVFILLDWFDINNVGNRWTTKRKPTKYNF